MFARWSGAPCGKQLTDCFIVFFVLLRVELFPSLQFLFAGVRHFTSLKTRCRPSQTPIKLFVFFFILCSVAFVMLYNKHMGHILVWFVLPYSACLERRTYNECFQPLQMCSDPTVKARCLMWSLFIGPVLIYWLTRAEFTRNGRSTQKKSKIKKK